MKNTHICKEVDEKSNCTFCGEYVPLNQKTKITHNNWEEAYEKGYMDALEKKYGIAIQRIIKATKTLTADSIYRDMYEEIKKLEVYSDPNETSFIFGEKYVKVKAILSKLIKTHE